MQITNCSLDIVPTFHCVLCDKLIHRGDSECICSTFRPTEFAYSSLCIKCAETYDRLMSDEDFKPILKYLFNKRFWEGVGLDYSI